MMLITEQIHLKHSKELSQLCFKAKNLYNLANWMIRQRFIKYKRWLRYNELYTLLKLHETYQTLPT